MEINNRYRIESDSLNITLLERSKNKDGGESDNYTAEGHFFSVGEALKYLVTNEIKGTGMKDFKIIAAKIEELEELIDKLSASKITVQDILRDSNKCSKDDSTAEQPPSDKGLVEATW